MALPPQALALTMIRVRIVPFLRPAVGYRTDAAIASGLLVPAFLGPSELIHDNRLHPGQQALTSIWKQNPERERAQDQVIEMFDPGREIPGVEPDAARRLWGRYGEAAPCLAACFADSLQFIPGTPYLWAELAWEAGPEPVRHLDDLLLRSFRFGILLPDGGESLLPKMRLLIKKNLGWNEERGDEA